MPSVSFSEHKVWRTYSVQILGYWVSKFFEFEWYISGVIMVQREPIVVDDHRRGVPGSRVRFPAAYC